MEIRRLRPQFRFGCLATFTMGERSALWAPVRAREAPGPPEHPGANVAKDRFSRGALAGRPDNSSPARSWPFLFSMVKSGRRGRDSLRGGFAFSRIGFDVPPRAGAGVIVGDSESGDEVIEGRCCCRELIGRTRELADLGVEGLCRERDVVRGARVLTRHR